MRKEPEGPIICPSCGATAEMKSTQFGRRDACKTCGLHSWHGKALVSEEVHKARNHCHEVFDRLWENSHEAYEILEPIGTPERRIAEARINRSARARASRFISYLTGLPEKECHMSDQADLEKLRRIWKAAAASDARMVRLWWKERGGESWWALQVQFAAQRKAEAKAIRDEASAAKKAAKAAKKKAKKDD